MNVKEKKDSSLHLIQEDKRSETKDSESEERR
jgi:hypothetical protein